jgi:hypothetical protein
VEKGKKRQLLPWRTMRQLTGVADLRVNSSSVVVRHCDVCLCVGNGNANAADEISWRSGEIVREERQRGYSCSGQTSTADHPRLSRYLPDESTHCLNGFVRDKCNREISSALGVSLPFHS